MDTSDHANTSYERLPKLPNSEAESADGVYIGQSPVVGVTLKRVLRGHLNIINRLAWSPDGHLLASPSFDNTIRVWDVANGECIAVLQGHLEAVYSVSWSPDGSRLASGSADTTVRFWDTETWQLIGIVSEYMQAVPIVAWSPDGQRVAAATNRGELCIWDANTLERIQELKRRQTGITSLAWLADGTVLASGDSAGQITIEQLESGGTVARAFDAHADGVYGLIWAKDQNLLISCGADYTIRSWDWQTSSPIRVLESHTDFVSSIALSPDGKLLVSKSGDDTVRIWRTDTWQTVAIIPEWHDNSVFDNLAFHPYLPYLATQAKDLVVRVWEYDLDLLFNNPPMVESVGYTTAKLVLVGDSGVGKTGLGWRLAHGEFQTHASTHGQQFWVVDCLKTTRADGTECEAVLWDLAGQPIYRSIHAIFLDNVDMSLLLFDPTIRQEPLKGVEFWIGQLAGKRVLPPSVLVGTRVDRGVPVLTTEELDQFCIYQGISGGYIGTSAMTGAGVDELVNLIQELIPWDTMTTTVTTMTFKRVKDFVLDLKARSEFKWVLLTPEKLRQQLQATDAGWRFNDDEMMTAVGHLQTHGYVNILRSSSGQRTILLIPDLLVKLVASIILGANAHPRFLGALSETALLRGEYHFDELENLDKDDREILLDAATLLFLEHNICFRETLGRDTLLIFPSQIQQKRPLYDEVEMVDDVSYVVQGAVENVYAALVVLLGYTHTFTHVDHWQNQAQYEMNPGEICGFRQIEERAGEIELILYYATTTPSYVRAMFQGMFENFLYQRDVGVTRYPPIRCANDHLQERAIVIKRLRERKDFLFCPECGERVTLPDLEESEALGELHYQTVSLSESLAKLRRIYEMHLSRVKGYRRDRAAPRCFISYVSSQAAWADTLVIDLRDAGVHVLSDRKQIRPTDYMLVLASEAYRKAWDMSAAELSADKEIISARMAGVETQLTYVVPLMVDGDLRMSRPRDLYKLRTGDFRDDTRRVVTLYDLVLSLYNIPFSHPAFAPLRNDISQRWKTTLSEARQFRPEIYISYGWGGESEKLAEELEAAFQQRGVRIIRDKQDLEYRGQIKAFMNQISEGKCVILVISEKYLKSPNCCYELVQIARYGNFYDRIFPIILEDAKIYDPDERIRYVQHWERETSELDSLMKTVSAADMEGFREDIDLYTEIRALLPSLTDILSDMNTLTPDMHRKSGFEQIFDAVMERLEA